jgi:hypothetical protein
MTGYNILFPEHFEACGACAGTGTVMETSVHGVPLSKPCRREPLEHPLLHSQVEGLLVVAVAQ